MPSPGACPCCGSLALSGFLDLGVVPQTGIYRGDSTEGLPTLPLAFELCGSCGLVKQREPFPHRDYTEVNRPPKRRLPSYVSGIVDIVHSSSAQRDDLVLEIGCNDGALLNTLRKAGFGNLLGIEPSKDLCASARLTGATIINDYFSRETAGRILAEHGTPKAVVCRHTLEHVPDVQGFAEGLKKVAERGSAVTVIEVPDSAVITDRGYFFELWDEHLYYFHADNLARLLARQGFDVATVSLIEHQETRNIVMTMRPGRGITPQMPATAHPAWRGFGQRWSIFRERLLGAIIRARKPRYLIGAGHLQTNLVNYLGPGAAVDYLIDDDPAKAGKIAPVATGPGRIISTDQFLTGASEGTVVASGFGYPEWSEKILRRARTLALDIVDPRKLFLEMAHKGRQ